MTTPFFEYSSKFEGSTSRVSGKFADGYISVVVETPLSQKDADTVTNMTRELLDSIGTLAVPKSVTVAHHSLRGCYWKLRNTDVLYPLTLICRLNKSEKLGSDCNSVYSLGEWFVLNAPYSIEHSLSIDELGEKLKRDPKSLTTEELERLDDHYERITTSLAELQSHRSVFHELDGRLDEALELMKKASKSCPDNIEYVARIKRIEEKISKKG